MILANSVLSRLLRRRSVLGRDRRETAERCDGDALDGVSDGIVGLMEKNVVVTQDMVDAFTEEMQEAYKKYGDDEEIVHIMIGGIMCETLKKLGFAEGVRIFNEAPKWYA